MKRNLWVITALLVLAISVVGCKTQASTSSTAASNQSVTTTSTYPITVPAYFSGKKTFFEPIYAKVNPSVVFIQVVHPQVVRIRELKLRAPVLFGTLKATF